MNQLTLPYNEIIIGERFRRTYNRIEQLADSIRRFGVIQPVVVNANKELTAGGRRMAAIKLLGWTEVPVCYKETLSEADKYEQELEENIQREAMTWQEECRGIAKAHYARLNAKVLEGDFSWSQKMTGEMLGLSVGNVNYCLDIAKLLDDEGKSPYWLCDSLMDAWRLKARDEEDRLLAEIARREALNTLTPTQIKENELIVKSVLAVEKAPDLLASERERYQRNPLNTVPFEEYWAEKVRLRSEIDNTIHLSNRFFLGDSIKFMNEHEGQFDHIVTDIPYGIDMDMLDQQNPHGGMNDLDTVKEEHDVEYNKQLIADFFPAAFKTTKEKAFVVTWADQMLWQYMYDIAIAAGFRVQRWPITWVKTSSCMNQMAYSNFTKSTEIAIVCRKPGTSLIKAASTCVVSASNEEMKRITGHPFAKPFEAWQKIVDHVSLEGQHILEPFAGRGSGVLSMLRMKRVVTAVELQGAHFNALLENVKTQHYLKLNPNYKFV